MIAELPTRNRPDADKKTPPESRNALAWGSWLAVLALGGYLLFAHGCHGDEDNELCPPPWRRPPAEAPGE